MAIRGQTVISSRRIREFGRQPVMEHEAASRGVATEPGQQRVMQKRCLEDETATVDIQDHVVRTRSGEVEPRRRALRQRDLGLHGIGGFRAEPTVEAGDTLSQRDVVVLPAGQAAGHAQHGLQQRALEGVGHGHHGFARRRSLPYFLRAVFDAAPAGLRRVPLVPVAAGALRRRGASAGAAASFTLGSGDFARLRAVFVATFSAAGSVALCRPIAAMPGWARRFTWLSAQQLRVLAQHFVRRPRDGRRSCGPCSARRIPGPAPPCDRR